MGISYENLCLSHNKFLKFLPHIRKFW